MRNSDAQYGLRLELTKGVIPVTSVGRIGHKEGALTDSGLPFLSQYSTCVLTLIVEAKQTEEYLQAA